MRTRETLLARARQTDVWEAFCAEEATFELLSDSPSLAPTSPAEAHQMLEDAYWDLYLDRVRDVRRIGYWCVGYGEPSDWRGWIFEKAKAGFAPLPEDHIPEYMRWTMED